MSNTQIHNPLIRRHKEGELSGAPNIDDYNLMNQWEDFIKAHRVWLKQLRLENVQAAMKIMDGIRRQSNSDILSYLSGILHIRKEYAAFLTAGIQTCDSVLGETSEL